MYKLPCCALALALSSVPASSQLLLHVYDGEAADARLGGNFDFVGDLTGDGLPDFVAGFPLADGPGVKRGRVALFSGRDGSLVREYFSDGDNEQIGECVRAGGDVDNDGVTDYLAGSTKEYGGRGAVRVYSGASGHLIHYIRGTTVGEDFGFSVAPIGRTNVDAYDDFAIGVPGWDDPVGFPDLGRVLIYSGLTGQVLHTLASFDVHRVPGRRLGTKLAWVGDINADGFDDILSGAFFTDHVCSTCFLGVALVHSGYSGVQISKVDSNYDHHVGEAQVVGSSLAGLGDIDGDGRDEYLVGVDEMYECAGAWIVQDSGNVIRKHSYVGCDSDTGNDWTPPVALGDAANLGDLNGDGRPDAIFDAGQPGWVDVRSGANGSLIFALPGDEDDGFKAAFRACGDFNGDGVPDIAVGLPLADFGGNDAGRIEIWSGVPCGEAFTYCVGAANSAGPGARMGYQGSTSRASDDLVLEVSGGPHGQFGLFYFAPNQIQIAYGNGYRCAGGGFFRLGLRQLSASGTASFAIDYHSGSQNHLAPGSTWCFQYLYRDPQGGGTGFNGSDGLSLQFCP